MRSRRRVLGLALLPLLLSGCAAQVSAAAPAATVTVTATPSASTPKAGDETPWDLQATCAAESEVETLIVWRKQQTEAGRLTKTQSAAVLQAIAVQYLEFSRTGLPASVRKDVDALAGASGKLEDPGIDLDSTAVRTAKDDLHEACQDAGYTIGVIAQGG